jgi:hypothetical protein
MVFSPDNFDETVALLELEGDEPAEFAGIVAHALTSPHLFRARESVLRPNIPH